MTSISNSAGPVFDSGFTYLRSGLTQREIVTARAILIFLVVLGHVRSGGLPFYQLKVVIYNFHVMAFFMIAMLKPVPAFSLKNLASVATRYLRHLIPVATLAFILFQLALSGNDFAGTIRDAGTFAKALLGGNYRAFDQSAGLELFWFMYALIGLVWLRMVLQHVAHSRLAVWGVFGACVVIGSLSAAYFPEQIPAWIGISSYILPVLVLAFYGFDQLHKAEGRFGTSVRYLVVAGFLTLAVFWAPHNSYNLAWLKVPQGFDLINCAIWIVFLSFSFFIITIFAKIFANIPFMHLIGSYSGGIYLTHMFFLYPFEFILVKTSMPDVMIIPLVLLFTIPLSYLATLVIRKI